MKAVYIIFKSLLFLSLMSHSVFAVGLNDENLQVEYRCVSSQKIKFKSGDDAFRTAWVNSMEWSPEAGKSLNLVVGDHDVIFWVRQPYNTNERAITILRKIPGKGMRPDKTDLDFGVIGQTVEKNVEFDIQDSYLGKVSVSCHIQMK
ncbi:MAG: hypothetical protein ACLGGX_10445 [Bdellovibrionia bacterium]